MKKIIAKILRKKTPWYELLGWYGTAAYLSAYVLISVGFYEPHDYGYQLLNISGSLAFIIFAYYRRIYQSIVANGIWLLIGLVALINLLVTSTV